MVGWLDGWRGMVFVSLHKDEKCRHSLHEEIYSATGHSEYNTTK